MFSLFAHNSLSIYKIDDYCRNVCLLQTFRDAFSECRTVVLASGTLTPMDSLKTELGTDFKMQMEGEQVIAKERIFASVLSTGPSGLGLSATYRRANEDFFYELGSVIKCVIVLRFVLTTFCLNNDRGVVHMQLYVRVRLNEIFGDIGKIALLHEFFFCYRSVYFVNTRYI